MVQVHPNPTPKSTLGQPNHPTINNLLHGTGLILDSETVLYHYE